MTASESVLQPTSMRMLASFRRFLHWLTSIRVVLSLIMLVLMFVFVIIPLYSLVETTVTWSQHDLTRVPDAVVGELTIFHWVRMLTGVIGRIYTYTPLQHSMTIAIGATLLSLLIGGALAWLVVRTDMPGRRIINQLAVLPYIMPSWTIAQAWLVLFKNRLTGGTPGLFEFLVGQAPPNWLSYGPVPIIICSALHYYTFFFLFVSAALMSIDSNLEEAGDLMGASRGRILRKITFPLVIPAILSGVIMTFSKVMGTFGGPNILGLPVRYYVVATMIRGSMAAQEKGDAFVLAIVLILFAITTISLNQRLVGTRRSYETIGGRGFVARLNKLGKMKRVLFIAVIIFQILVIAVPIGLLLYNTLMLIDGNYSLNNLTLQHWIGPRNTVYNHGEPGVLRNPIIYSAAWNSIKLALWTAFCTALLGIVLGYAIVKGRGTRLSKLVEQLAFIPYIIPGIAFGAVYIAMFARKLGPIPPLYGTFALLVIVSVTKHIPFSSRSGVSAMMQVGRELEEAGIVAGANVWQRFRRIIFPLTSSGFMSGFLMTFITTMRELSLIILLVTPTTQLLASQTMQYTENGDGQEANAVILILIAIVVLGNFIIGRFSRGSSLQKGLGM
ncbi:MAG: iron ABC transporter permease [Anaerolineae bacterium CG17_big_fil_post_rev_8_21_14_2_50_57_27]|nr:MAG: iron ABC transporter permease [Anaerolineae bacterium CG06_land_8_20_14_3_00_57_67]PIW20376.1 MAG: iron ABC transporter permease [Anaerolineae bacterium CG17_big_fil_post_rev_8_21_14_2_50_57_27]